MKKVILIILVGLFSFSCAITDQQKAENEVKRHLLSVLNDPNSYESASFSDIKPCKLDFGYTQVGESMYKMLESELSMLSASGGNIDTDVEYKKNKIEFESKAEKFNNSTNSNGWMITHKYRGKNEYGGVISVEKTFYLDAKFYCEYSR